MQRIRLIAVVFSVLLFSLTGLFMHFAMDKSDYLLCDKRTEVTIVALIALALLVVALRIRPDETSAVQRRLVKAAAYLLVVAVSAGFWFDVWATQQCNETPRKRLERRVQHARVELPER